MPDLYCEWNDDLILTAKGDIQTASGWDRVRQRIVRSLITNSAQTLPDGSTTVSDYVFHPDYGLGAGSLIGQVPSQQWRADFISRVNRAVLQDISVNPGSVPVVKFSNPTPGTWIVYIAVQLSNNTTGRVSVRIS